MNIPEIIKALADHNLSAVARKTGLSHTVIYNLMSGRVKNPSHVTVLRLIDYLEGHRNG